MKDAYSYVARQPILDREKKTVAYELLFRDGPKNTFPEVEPELATSRLLSEQFLSAQSDAIGSKLGFVNFPYNSLINGIPTLFPKDKVVVEILEDCEPTDELLEAIKQLAAKGYKVALDDFVPSPGWIRFLPYIDIIKFDIQIVPVAKAIKFIDKLRETKIQFLAEKVETYEEFHEAKEAGFDFFQGYFFSKPEILQQKTIEPSFLTTVQLSSEAAAEDINYDEVERIISTDVSLSYKLLRYVNSSAAISSEIKSFHQALVYLGQSRLRKFIALVALTSANESKPDSLYGLSIHRARICELLYRRLDKKNDGKQAFLVGMFSLLDSLMDQPLESILEAIPLDNAIKDALLKKEGALGKLLSVSIAYENADWKALTWLADELGLSQQELISSYESATEWAEELFSGN
ncbi:EAL domain-containing protein [Vibrio sp. JC009]|uniref:EAL and HDOD domain-containing protein n=1 Tax=Vibrio sp. JC009 TaxID=2912314 RepID=UPI0023AFE993|nr:HDOD domain-containing protein [Vibrio sp. JC009]WED22752.1 EAL domain-containing protein [Vibrio sp. JC009]